MNMAQMSQLNMEEIQLLAAAAAAANAQAYAAQSSRQATPPATPSVAVTPVASSATTPKASANNTRTPTPTHNGVSAASTPQQVATPANSLDPQSQSKYQHLLSVIEEMSKDIRPTYAGSKSSAERLKRGIVYARILVRECQVEAERTART